MLPLIAIGALLCALLFATFSAKDNRFGSTPFYASVALGWQQALGYSLYPLERAVRDFFAALSGSAAVSGVRSGDARAMPVITYHRLVDDADGANVTFANFKDQMEALKNAGWDTITLKEYEAYMRGDISLPERSVLVTFDDGAKQSFYPVDPILKSLDFNAVNYIIVGDSTRSETTYYLSPQEIRNMLDTGRWEIGSHSYAGHNPYPVDAAGHEGHFFSDKLWLESDGRLETDEEFRARVEADMRDARDALATTYGSPIRGFAFPFGDTGETSVNYPESHGVVVAAAADIYDYAWVQPGAGQFTFNYPHEDSFLMRRIKVAPEWEGEDLIAALERGVGKPIPYTDDMTADRGWMRTWGSVQTLPDGTLFSANAESAGASAFLDGTGFWQNYEATMRGDWESGYAVVMASLSDSTHYRDCAFNDGEVSIRETRGDARDTLAAAKNAAVRRGSGVSLGIRVQNGIVQCLYEGGVVLEVRGITPRTGGVGFQVWHPQTGTASFFATELSVIDISETRLPRLSSQKAPTQSSLPAIPNTGVPAQESTPVPVSTGAVAQSPSPTATTHPATSTGSTHTTRRRDRERDEGSRKLVPTVQSVLDGIMKERDERSSRGKKPKADR